MTALPVPTNESADALLVPLELLVAALRSQYGARMHSVYLLRAEFNDALDTYVRTAEQMAAREIAQHLGVDLEVIATPSMAHVEDELRRLVGCLLPSEQQSQDVATPAGIVLRPASTIDAEALLNDLDAVAFDELGEDECFATLRFFAARARLLKEQGDDPDLADRCIKRLTAVAHENGAPSIRGLRRTDRFDWKRESNAAEACLARIRAGCSERIAVPIEIPDSVVEELAEPKEQTREELPALTRATTAHPLVVVGGIVDANKQAWIERVFGLRSEWVTAQGNVREVQRLVERMGHGGVPAAVLLEGLMSHPQYDAIKAAAQRSGTPLAYANKGGTGSLREALRELERAKASQERAVDSHSKHQ